MRKAIPVVVMAVGIGAGITLIGIYAQTKPTQARLIPAAKVDDQIPIPGLDCARTPFVIAKVGDMAACPADKPFLNGIMYGAQTQTGGIGSLNQIEWSFYCCKVTAATK